MGRIVRLGGRRVDHAVGGAWHTVVRTDTGESYVMGCILPSGSWLDSWTQLRTAPAFCPTLDFIEYFVDVLRWLSTPRASVIGRLGG